MLDWVLSTPLNAITIFFPDVSKLKLMTFSMFFQRLTFPTNTCQRLRRIQNPVEHSTIELSRKIFFFCKIHKQTPVLEPHFNKVTGLYPAISLKERTPTEVFSGEFCQILKTPFLQNTSSRPLLLYRKNILSIKQYRIF